MSYYAVISAQKIKAVEASEVPELKELQNLVGIEGAEAYIEPIYAAFSDPKIILLCDEEFLLHNGWDITCEVPKNKTVLHGQVLALGLGEENFTLLTAKQIEIVKAELTLLA